MGRTYRGNHKRRFNKQYAESRINKCYVSTSDVEEHGSLDYIACKTRHGFSGVSEWSDASSKRARRDMQERKNCDSRSSHYDEDIEDCDANFDPTNVEIEAGFSQLQGRNVPLPSVSRRVRHRKKSDRQRPPWRASKRRALEKTTNHEGPEDAKRLQQGINIPVKKVHVSKVEETETKVVPWWIKSFASCNGGRKHYGSNIHPHGNQQYEKSSESREGISRSAKRRLRAERRRRIRRDRFCVCGDFSCGPTGLCRNKYCGAWIPTYERLSLHRIWADYFRTPEETLYFAGGSKNLGELPVCEIRLSVERPFWPPSAEREERIRKEWEEDIREELDPTFKMVHSPLIYLVQEFQGQTSQKGKSKWIPVIDPNVAESLSDNDSDDETWSKTSLDNIDVLSDISDDESNLESEVSIRELDSVSSHRSTSSDEQAAEKERMHEQIREKFLIRNKLTSILRSEDSNFCVLATPHFCLRHDGRFSVLKLPKFRYKLQNLCDWDDVRPLDLPYDKMSDEEFDAMILCNRKERITVARQGTIFFVDSYDTACALGLSNRIIGRISPSPKQNVQYHKEFMEMAVHMEWDTTYAEKFDIRASFDGLNLPGILTFKSLKSLLKFLSKEKNLENLVAVNKTAIDKALCDRLEQETESVFDPFKKFQFTGKDYSNVMKSWQVFKNWIRSWRGFGMSLAGLLSAIMTIVFGYIGIWPVSGVFLGAVGLCTGYFGIVVATCVGLLKNTLPKGAVRMFRMTKMALWFWRRKRAMKEIMILDPNIMSNTIVDVTFVVNQIVSLVRHHGSVDIAQVVATLSCYFGRVEGGVKTILTLRPSAREYEPRADSKVDNLVSAIVRVLPRERNAETNMKFAREVRAVLGKYSFGDTRPDTFKFIQRVMVRTEGLDKKAAFLVIKDELEQGSVVPQGLNSPFVIKDENENLFLDTLAIAAKKVFDRINLPARSKALGHWLFPHGFSNFNDFGFFMRNVDFTMRGIGKFGPWFVDRVLDLGDLAIGTTPEVDVKQWKDAAVSLLRRIEATTAAMQRAEALELLRLLHECDMVCHKRPRQYRLIMPIQKRMLFHMANARSALRSDESTVQPIWMHVYGDAGIGKTELIDKIRRRCWFTGSKDEFMKIYTLPGAEPYQTDFKARSKFDKNACAYWDGYKGEPLVANDDFGITTELCVLQAVYRDIVQMVSQNPCPPMMADVNKMDMHPFCSEMYFTAANVPQFPALHSCVTCTGAIYRRNCIRVRAWREEDGIHYELLPQENDEVRNGAGSGVELTEEELMQYITWCLNNRAGILPAPAHLIKHVEECRWSRLFQESNNLYSLSGYSVEEDVIVAEQDADLEDLIESSDCLAVWLKKNFPWVILACSLGIGAAAICYQLLNGKEVAKPITNGEPQGPMYAPGPRTVGGHHTHRNVSQFPSMTAQSPQGDMSGVQMVERNLCRCRLMGRNFEKEFWAIFVDHLHIVTAKHWFWDIELAEELLIYRNTRDPCYNFPVNKLRYGGMRETDIVVVRLSDDRIQGVKDLLRDDGANETWFHQVEPSTWTGSKDVYICKPELVGYDYRLDLVNVSSVVAVPREYVEGVIQGIRRGWEVTPVVTGHVLSRKGDCGLPWVTLTPKAKPCILGVHVAGKDGAGPASCAVLTPIMLRRMKSVCEAWTPGDILMLPQAVPYVGASSSQGKTLCKMEDYTVSGPQSSILRPGPFSKVVADGTELPWIKLEILPAILRIHHGVDPMKLLLEKLTIQNFSTVPHYELVSQWFRDQFITVKPYYLTPAEAIMGNALRPDRKPIEFNSACGYPWMKIAKTKKKLFCPNGNWNPNEVFIKYYYKWISGNPKARCIRTLFLKDELRSTEKVKACSTRGVFGCTAHMLLAKRSWLPAYDDSIRATSHKTGICAELSPDDWAGFMSTRVAGLQWPIVCWCLDVAKMDITQPYCVQLEHNKDCRKVCLNGRVMDVIERDTETKEIKTGDTIIVRKSGNDSGDPHTAWVNSTFSFKSVVCFWLEMGYKLEDFQRFVRPVILGDDMLVFMSLETAKRFSMVDFRAFMNSFDMEITAFDKKHEIQPYYDISEVSFLHRRVYADGQWAGWLSEESMWKPIAWYRQTAVGYPRQFYENIKWFIVELALYPPKRRKEMAILLRDALVEKEMEVPEDLAVICL